MSADSLTVAVVGATGAVGREMIRILQERKFPVGMLIPLASERSAGAEIEWRGGTIRTGLLDEDAFEDVDLALFSAGAAVSEAFAKHALAAGAVVIDNTSAFRMDADVPLVVPEVNSHQLASQPKLVANPNCSTIQAVVPLKPLHDLAGLKRVVFATYQSASGAGQDAMDELRDQTIALLSFREVKTKVFGRRLAFDVLPEIDRLLDDGSTREERKMIDETRKILELPELAVSVTCARVPVFVGHAVAVHAEFERPIDLEAARAALEAAPGVDLRDDYGTCGDAVGQDDCIVGRLRVDPGVPGGRGLAFWVTADNLRKGAATNSVQIAERIFCT